MLTIKNLSLSKSDKTLIRNFSLTLQTGDIFCLAGRNGAGKSSILRCIAGLERNFSGEIHLSLDTDDNRKKMGIMLDGPAMYSHLSLYDNLDIIRRYHRLKIDTISPALELVGLTNEADKKVKNCSAGMKQRLAIAMALIHKPSLIILDEPLNALDLETIIDIRKLILHLNITYRTTFIITSHALEEIKKIFTRMIILKDGSAVQEINKNDLDQYLVTANMTYGDDALLRYVQSQKILTSMEADKLQILINKEQFSELKERIGDINLNIVRPASIEDIYLFVNQ